MRIPAVFLLLAVSAYTAGCVSYGVNQGSCDGVSCSEHGQCQESEGMASCNCDTGYEPGPDDPLSCVPTENGPIIVDVVTGIEDPQDGQYAVHLLNHQDVYLAEKDIDLMFLQTSLEYGTAVYLQIELDSRLIQEVLVPYDSPVESLLYQSDRIEVQLIYSAAIHVLLRSQEGFEAMQTQLEQSLSDGSRRLVTETRESHTIIDVRLPLDGELD